MKALITLAVAITFFFIGFLIGRDSGYKEARKIYDDFWDDEEDL